MYKSTDNVRRDIIFNSIEGNTNVIKRESTEFSAVSSFIASVPSIIDEPIIESRIPKKGKTRTLPVLSDEFKLRTKLPRLSGSVVDPDRYQKAYLKALHVAKFGQYIPPTWNEFFNHQITPAFIFSYKTHTPKCINKPTSCNHNPRDDKKISKTKAFISISSKMCVYMTF